MAEGAPAAPKEGPPTTFVTEEEIGRAVIVRGIPMAEHGRTTDALLRAFSDSFGRVTRLIVQASDAPGESSPGAQHAVVIFAEQGAAEAALDYNGRHVLAQPVTVHPAAMAEEAAGAAAEVAGPGNPRRPVRAVATLLADGYFAGEKGLAYVSGVSERLGVTSAFKQALSSVAKSTKEFAEAHDMSGRLDSAAASAQRRVNQVDEALGLREAAAQAGERLSAAAAALGQQALRSGLIARSVEGVQSLARQTADAIGMTAVATRVEIADRRQKGDNPAEDPAPVPSAADVAAAADDAEEPSASGNADAGASAAAVEPNTPAAPEE